MKLLSILWNSFKMALQELRVNKLRTFLSLFGITIGIFCVIGVLSTIDSLQRKMEKDFASFANNTIFIDKWEYIESSDYPWWKFINRPDIKYTEMQMLKANSMLAGGVCFFVETNTNINYLDATLNNVSIYGTTEDFTEVQQVEVGLGRYFSTSEFSYGSNTLVIGHQNAEDLFGSAEKALNKEISLQGKTFIIIGVIKKQGDSFIGGFDYDKCAIITYNAFSTIWIPEKNQPKILVKAKDGVTKAALLDELSGIMRQVRKLKPTQEPDFALNDISSFGDQISSVFGSINLGGWLIAGLSLIVGGFGIANIMFVTVRERTSQIGLKKAIGAKKTTILTEFLLESAFLCVLGGFLGLLLVWILTQILSTMLPFPIFIAPYIIVLAFSICIFLGVLSGIIPARIAANMNAVEAIRSK